MIRSYFGLTDNPFAHRDIQLLPHQQEIYDTLQVHCQQGGLCLVVANRAPESQWSKSRYGSSATSNTWSPPSRGRCTPTPTRSRFSVRRSDRIRKLRRSSASGD